MKTLLIETNMLDKMNLKDYQILVESLSPIYEQFPYNPQLIDKITKHIIGHLADEDKNSNNPSRK